MSMKQTGLLALLLTVFAADPALAAPEADAALARVRGLDQEAMAAFDGYAYNKGRRKLEQALEVARQAGLAKKPQLAATHVLLAIAAQSGSNDSYRALHHFVTALRLDPKIGLPKRLVTPELKRAFANAKRTAKVVGKPPKLAMAGRRAQRAAKAVARQQAKGLDHSPIDEAKRGFPVPVKVAIGAELRVQRVFLYYRAAGKVKFTRLEMGRRSNVYRASIPAKVTNGPYLHYYVEARDPRGRLAVSNGSSGSPNVVTIK
jgi:tetratricopeptide (TPR) repeat protein